MVNRRDGKIVDYFVGKDYRNLQDQLDAVVRTDGTGADVAGQAFANGVQPLDAKDPAFALIPRKTISLVDVELNDNGVITHKLENGDSDARQMVFHLQGRDATPSRTGNEVDAVNRLLNGDADFDGQVGPGDFNLLASNFGKTGEKWSQGDFDFDGSVGPGDFNLLATNFGLTLPGGGGVLLSSSDWATLEAFGASIGSPVPEPTALAAVILGGIPLMRRRRLGKSRR